MGYLPDFGHAVPPSLPYRPIELVNRHPQVSRCFCQIIYCRPFTHGTTYGCLHEPQHMHVRLDRFHTLANNQPVEDGVAKPFYLALEVSYKLGAEGPCFQARLVYSALLLKERDEGPQLCGTFVTSLDSLVGIHDGPFALAGTCRTCQASHVLSPDDFAILMRLLDRSSLAFVPVVRRRNTG